MAIFPLILLPSQTSKEQASISDSLKKFDAVYQAVEQSDYESAEALSATFKDNPSLYCHTKALGYEMLTIQELRSLLDSCESYFLKGTKDILEEKISELVDISGSLDYMLNPENEKRNKEEISTIESCYARAYLSNNLNGDGLTTLLDDCEDVFTNSVRMRVIGKLVRLQQKD